MKAFIKVQSNHRSQQFQIQRQTYETKFQSQVEIAKKFQQQIQRIDRIHGKQNDFFLERIFTGQNWHNSSQQNQKDPSLYKNLPVEEQLVVGKSFKHKSCNSLPTLEKNADQQEVIEALLRAQGMNTVEIKKEAFSRTFCKSLQKGNVTFLSFKSVKEGLLKSFAKMSKTQQNFLKIQRPDIELLKGKAFKIRKQKIPYLRQKNDEQIEQKQFQQIMIQLKQKNKSQAKRPTSLENLLRIQEELSINLNEDQH